MRSRRFLILGGLALAVGVAVYLREPNKIPAGPSSGAFDLRDDEDSEERERGVTLGTLPEPARAAILAEAGGHELVEVEEIISFSGETFYEAEWIEGGMEVEVAVAPDGTVLGREMEELDGDEEDED